MRESSKTALFETLVASIASVSSLLALAVFALELAPSGEVTFPMAVGGTLVAMLVVGASVYLRRRTRRPKATVFFAYAWEQRNLARRLMQDLSARWPYETTSLDESLPIGADIDAGLRALLERADFIVLVYPGIRPTPLRARFIKPEIAAIARSGKPILPIVVGGGDASLPIEIRDLRTLRISNPAEEYSDALETIADSLEAHRRILADAVRVST